MAAFQTTRRTIPMGDSEIIIEHGKLALQASGAVTVQWGDTIVLVTATHQALDAAGGVEHLLIVSVPSAKYSPTPVKTSVKKTQRLNINYILQSR